MSASPDPKSDMKSRIAKVLLDEFMSNASDEATILKAKEKATLILEAMREPTELMAQAAGYWVGSDVWYTMIDCAIHESEKKEQ